MYPDVSHVSRSFRWPNAALGGVVIHGSLGVTCVCVCVFSAFKIHTFSSDDKDSPFPFGHHSKFPRLWRDLSSTQDSNNQVFAGAPQHRSFMSRATRAMEKEVEITLSFRPVCNFRNTLPCLRPSSEMFAGATSSTEMIYI